jgi:hypothetical protein
VKIPPQKAIPSGGRRIDADAIEHAITAALAGFYRHQHDLIADAIAAARDSHAADQHGRRGELAATEHELARTGAAINPSHIDQVIASGTHSQRKALIERWSHRSRSPVQAASFPCSASHSPWPQNIPRPATKCPVFVQ